MGTFVSTVYGPVKSEQDSRMVAKHHLFFQFSHAILVLLSEIMEYICSFTNLTITVSSQSKMAQTYAILLALFVCLFCHKNISFASKFNTSTDEASLLALKARITSDPNNYLTTNWSRGTSFCTWIGVTCSRRHARVVALDLFNMSLHGTIAPDIGSLSFMRFINLSNNSFTSIIPDEIGNLRRLRYLYMRFNQLSGSIPWSIFNVSSLREIGFSCNRLSGSLAPNMCRHHAAKLEKLGLSRNQLVGEIPRSLSQCADLEILSLSYNNFTGSVPVEIGNLSKLQLLYLGRNHLTGTIPSSLGNLSNLEELDLQENNIEGEVPSEIGNLSNLTYLGLSTNKLKGELPPSIFNLSRLEILSLAENELSGSFPRSIDKGLPNLQIFYLGYNHFTGEIPSSFSNLSKLRVVDFANNSFSGLIPIKLGNLQHLQIIRLANNMFTNDLSIPEQEFLTPLTNCRNLNDLQISKNPITGVIPKSLGNLSASLQYLLAGVTRIRGTIPSEIGNLHNLLWLDLGENELTGEIPQTLGRLRNLQVLTVSRNRLHGTIPNSICSLENLFDLELKDTWLTGHLPRCLGNLSSLRELYLSNNSLSSRIPSTLWSNRNLQTVDLSHNLFQGSLSDEIGNLKSLINLSLNGNQFSGRIPSTMGNLISLQYVDLSQNNFSDSIPNSLETLMDLDYFNVSFNQLSGEIPIEGHFQNFTAKLFMGNKDLCGAPRFGVEACKRNTPNLSRQNKHLRYILPSVVSIVFATAVVIFLLKRRSRNSHVSSLSESSVGLKHERISYYEILRVTSNLDVANLIGRGSISSVFKATFSNETTAAIKVFNLDLQGAFKSFDTECQIMRNLRHRNLVKVITSCSNLDFKALVMEYMPNGNLDKWLHNLNYGLKIAERLEKMIDVASAIEYLHHGYSSSVVHCDLKPSNILLDEDMVAHVADFGISKLLTEDQRMEQTKTLGTIGYMAPEYGSAGLVSIKVDVYSFGILLMETVTKKKPTNEMFLGELTMRGWVSDSYPSTVMQIVDADLLNSENEYADNKFEECMVSIMELAIQCATDLPEERPDMKDVLVRLKKINIKLHSTVTEVQYSRVVSQQHMPIV